jgi:DNA-directed RNA polymerase subunit RPC12/RpoP
MANFFTAFKEGLAGKEGEGAGDKFTVAEKAVACPHCAHNRFYEGRALLNTAGMTFFKLDWANQSAATLTCTRCGHIAWFLEDPKETE